MQPVVSNEINDEYNPKSCNLSEKDNYTPIEAAIRWCGLSQYEQRILERAGNGIPGPNEFPQWPCLRINLLKIRSAISDNAIEYALDGIIPQQNWYPYPSVVASHLAQGTLTIHRNVLKSWIAENYPDQKPAFLFDEVERTTHTAINANSFRILQADRDALKVKLDSEISERKALEETYNTSITEKDLERDELLKTIDGLKSQLNAAHLPGERSERSYQNMIAALLECISGVLPDFKKSPSFVSEAKLIETISAFYIKYDGLSQSNLSHKFPECKRNLKKQ